MPREETILQTKLNPPYPPRYALIRPRIDALLQQAFDHRVTIVQASTGYGKSTALAHLTDVVASRFWYTPSESDADPQQFASHLIAAFQRGLPMLPDIPLALMQDTHAGVVLVAIDTLLNALNDALDSPALFVIDDYHLAASPDVNALVDHFLTFLPNNLHAIISSRYAPAWEHLVIWRAHGQVLEIKRETIAFTREEIAALFRDKFAHELAPREVTLLEEKTEGWPIALQLVWQEIRANPKSDVFALISRDVGNQSDQPYLETLFAYLAQDVLAQQPRDLQEFMLQTSTLREFDAGACHAVSRNSDCRASLAQLRERDLFVVSLGDEHYRYHHLFHDFLRDHAAHQSADAVRERHCRAAEYYRGVQNYDEAVYHWLCAGAYVQAAELVEEIGESVLRVGRLDTLASWIDGIPPEHVAAHPLLMFYLGDLARLHSRFDDALAWYAQAERAWRAVNDIRGISRALRGQALVYLDTVRPSRAEDLLQEALRLNDGLDDRAARARLLELLAENKLNMGKAEEAEKLREEARTLREEGPSEDVLSVRVKLRTGRLDEAREILESWSREERGQLHPPRAHRETPLILSLIYAMQGRADDAFATAQEGTLLGAQSRSPFVSAVGQMRLGHAYQIRGDLRTAIRCYEEAVALGDRIAVRRTRAEAMWGLTRAYGYGGDLESAWRDASEGIEIGKSAGDAWIVALLQIALGASQVLAQRSREATDTLGDALAVMRSCGDTFGSAAARVWLALSHWQQNQRERAVAHLDEALSLAEPRRYDYLFTVRTLLGMQDARLMVPLLIEMRNRHKHTAYVVRLLTAMGLENITVHPGYQLRVQTLGAFRVWRGETEISSRDWQRKKARQLFQLFATRRGQSLEREEIYELLWRAESPEAAGRDFKVALNALNKVLEPERRGDFAYIVRTETAYGFRPGADVWIDADEFTQLIARAEASAGDALLDLLRRALALYQDDYLLADARYEDWAIAGRERLLAIYLRAADRLAEELLTRNSFDECISWCEKILTRDRCWEHAYRLMMRAYAARGDRAQARRVFEQCERVLREDLNILPSEATEQEFKRVVNG